ncbi:MAG: diaminopimelate epimerase [Candidatus Omnitrophota bacterium]
MKKIVFTKVVASGNDFIVIDQSYPLSAIRYPLLVKQICDRKFGVGADGLLLLEKSKKADVRMRIFNADGSEARMCGNGARCVAFYASSRLKTQGSRLKIETKAGIIEAEVKGESVRIKLTKPEDYRPDLIIKINNRKLRVNFINTGVPHAVIFVAGINKINAVEIGRAVRYHKGFAPKGANVNFVEVVDKDTIRLRTYERGVEEETLACGTGSVASAIVFSCQLSAVSCQQKINVITQGGETLKVCFMKEADRISDVWLEGKVRIVYGGEYYV